MTHSDIPFATDDAHAFLPWVIGIMACIATLLLCLGITVGSWIVDRHQSYTGSFTVNIPASAGADSDKIRDALQKTPGVTGVSPLPEAKLREMLTPWLGAGAASADLPLPIVMDVSVNDKTPMDYKDLQTRLTAIAPGTEVDAHERWIANFIAFSNGLQWLMACLAVLLIGGLALMIAFTSRASLKLHAKTVQLLHSIGAEDGYISQQFQREALLVTLRGALPGCIAAGLVYWGGGYFIASLKASMLPSLAMGVSHVMLLALMPLACGLVASVTARFSVLQLLQHRL